MLDNLLGYKLENRKYIVIDCETESLNLIFSRPWSISWIVVDNKNIIEEYDKYLWWKDLQMSEGAARVTRFNYSNYKNKAEPPERVWDLLKNYLFSENYLIVGQNFIPFDLYQLRNVQLAIGQTTNFGYLNRVYDTLALAKAYKKQIKFNQNDNLLIWQFKMLSIIEKGLKCSLGMLCKDFKIDYDANLAHSSLYDILKTKEVFEKLIWQVGV